MPERFARRCSRFSAREFGCSVGGEGAGRSTSPSFVPNDVCAFWSARRSRRRRFLWTFSVDSASTRDEALPDPAAASAPAAVSVRAEVLGLGKIEIFAGAPEGQPSN